MQTELMQILLENKSDHNFKDQHGKTALHYASSLSIPNLSSHSVSSLLSLLLSYNASLDAEDDQKMLPQIPDASSLLFLLTREKYSSKQVKRYLYFKTPFHFYFENLSIQEEYIKLFLERGAKH